MSEPVQIPGFAQFPSNDKTRCPVSGMKRGSLRKYLEQWEHHDVHPVRVLRLKDSASAKRSIVLYNKDDVYKLLNYEAEQQQLRKEA